jgi:hypothetical protein
MQLRENPRGMLLRINEEVQGRRNTIIIPAPGLEECLFKVGYIAPALRRRFPWVFVDELRDTSAMQDRVIEQIFGSDDSIFQRFGDRNQAIFDFDADSDGGQQLFGRRKMLVLNGTHRFGNAIATLVSRFTAVEPQNLVGNPQSPDCEHTIFIFDRGAVKHVVPLFGDLVLKTVPSGILQKKSVCVVGRWNSGSSWAFRASERT